MTNIELETLQAVKAACKEYCKSQSWENVRIQAAIAIAQGRIASRIIIANKELFAETCVEYADALVEELKKKSND
jgi:hypothetical protein